MIREILKIPGDLVKKSKGNVVITQEEIKNEGYLIGIQDSQMIAWLDELRGTPTIDLERLYAELRSKKENEVAKSLLFINELVQVDYSSDKQFKEKFKLNDESYVWINSKGDSTNTYIREDLYEIINHKLNNGRNMSTKFIPAKLNAYLGLTLSSSTRICHENQPRHVVVVRDNEETFKATYTHVGTDGVYDITENVTIEASDGNGVIDYRLLEKWSKEDLHYQDYTSSGVSVRGAFLKGMVFPVDLQAFFKQHEVREITDVWGTIHSVDDIDIIIPTSMLKLWQSYESYEEYDKHCQENGYRWRVCKESHKVKASRTNYQMLTDLVMSDEQIQEFIQPTVQYLGDISGRDWLSTVLYLNGQSLKDESPALRGAAQAIMIEPRLINDNGVIQQVQNMISKRKNDACLGKLNINSDFQIISSDLYNFLCSACKIQDSGLLGAGEVYSRWHNDRGFEQGLLFRAPMISKENIAHVKIADSDRLKEFYKFMPDIVVLNDYDLTCDTLAGADKDGDTVLLVTDKILLEVHEPVLPCRCETCADGATKIPCDREELLRGAKLGCSNKFNIGSLINKVTMQFTIRSMFSPDSAEYKELSERILMGLMYSQSYIDAKKLGTAFEPPKHWFSVKACDLTENPEEQKLLCTQGKKPYFMVMYQAQSDRSRKDYKMALQEIELRANCYWGISADELLAIEDDDLNEEQRLVINHWADKLPCPLKDNSTMHRICKMTAQAIKDSKKNLKKEDLSQLLKDDEVEAGNVSIEKEIEKLVNEFSIERTRIWGRKCFGDRDSVRKVKISETGILEETLKQDVLALHENEQLVINCFINACQRLKKQYLIWTIFTDEVIQNLLKKHDYTMQIPIQDDNGDREYQSKRFRIATIKVDKLESTKIREENDDDDDYNDLLDNKYDDEVYE